MSDIVSVFVLALVVTSMGLTVKQLARSRARRATYLRTVRAIRWWMVPAAAMQLTVVAGTFWVLSEAVPILRFGWWSALGGSGNIALGQTDNSGFVWSALSLAIPAALVLLVPFLAHDEERTFRAGAEEWTMATRVRTQVTFGLIHLAMGIPVAAGIALIVSGFYFERLYLVAVRGNRERIAELRNVPPPAVIDCPPLPVGAPYDPHHWDRVQAERAAVRAENTRLRLAWEDGEDEASRRARSLRAELRAPALATAAAAHAVSNWIVCALLFVFMLTT
ncbi:hypothetical protein AB4Z09_09755 [Rhodococcus sp. TAF43]|uniref:hypothetical protein n=1 Tax=unclassified Rhodococcus (in: high G+C Gram-positive bacteria) TaxID=192944 RepID=UPI001581E01A|nr:hypothetical protein [Rhodococcus sp. W8901]QKT12143.1 hypothetical protein HUN07_16800 [Rhodococcus sp. W8901]